MVFRVLFISISFFFVFDAQAQILNPGTWEKTKFRDTNILDTECPGFINNLDAIQYHKNCQERTDEPSIRFIYPQLDMYYSSEYPRGYNDGPVWLGKGTTIALRTGFQAKWRFVDLTLQPVAYYSQNKDFYIASNPDKNPYSYPFHRRIDYVVRYGNDPFVKLFPGQSDLSVHAYNVRIGISTQNFQWGPSRYNPIIMGSQAPGIPHVYIGTDRPAKTAIGEFEVKQFWGQLSESDYFDSNPDNDERYIAGLSLGYRPKWIEGLNLAFDRALYTDFQYVDFEDYFITTFRFTTPDENPEGLPGNDEYDQLASVSARWTFPEVGFEPYLEFAKNDFGGTGFGFQPEHTRAITLGFTKWFDITSEYQLTVTGEHTTLGQSRTVLTRPTPTYYVHGIIPQGYTNQGQLLGAGIGPGSNSTIIHFKLYAPKSSHGAMVQALRFDDDYYYANFDDRYHFDYEIFAMYEGNFELKNYEIGFSLKYSRRSNWYYEIERDLNNWSASISLGF